MKYTNIIKAFQCCVEWHGEQKRKYTGEPYFLHPLAVAKTVSCFTDDEEVIIAALFHDVLEDTPVKPDYIAGMFGNEVLKLILEVTDVSKKEDGNRAVRKAIDNEHLSKASYYGKLIKLADSRDNTSTIVAYDKNFAKVYIAEKKVLMPLIKIDHELWYHTNALIDKLHGVL